MKRLGPVGTIGLVCAILSILVLGSISTARAQDWPPTIFLFESDINSITVRALNAGDVTATLRWHIAHTGASDRIELHAYQGSEWIALGSPGTPLGPVDELPITIEHPRNFGPPTYRISVVNATGQISEQRTLVIPFADGTDDLTPTIFSFSALDQSIPAADLNGGSARVRVSWVVKDRRPLTHILFEQVIGDNTVNVELPRAALYIPSQGSGVVAPVAPPSGITDGGTITLQLTIIDVISADVLDTATVNVAVMGTALPPESTPEPAPAVTEEAAPSFGALTILDNCTLFPPGVPERGWIDSPGIPSPNGLFIAYITNGVNDAELVIARANGTGQNVVDAPDKDYPLWSRPRWSPDSTRIAFNNIVIESPGGGTIYVANADGSDLRKVATYTGYYDDFSWSADGLQIFFTGSTAQDTEVAVATPNYQVYATRADGLGAPEPVASGCGVIAE